MRIIVEQNNICPFLGQGICIYIGHSFLYETQLNQLFLSVF